MVQPGLVGKLMGIVWISVMNFFASSYSRGSTNQNWHILKRVDHIGSMFVCFRISTVVLFFLSQCTHLIDGWTVF